MVDGELIAGGSFESPTSISVTGEIHQQVFSVEANSTQLLYNNELSGFTFLWIQSDRDIILEFTTDVGNDVGDEVYTLELAGTGTANLYGVPFILGSDDSYANYTVNFAGGTLDVIDRIRCRNLDTSNAAKVKIVVVK